MNYLKKLSLLLFCSILFDSKAQFINCFSSTADYTFVYLPNRTAFCPGENMSIKFTTASNISISTRNWSYSGTAAGFSTATAIQYNIAGLLTSGVISVSGSGVKGGSACTYAINTSITVGTSISAAPILTAAGTNITIAPTITSGTAPFAYTWLPNVFFVSPSTNASANPIVKPLA